jgi:hypothetical protein
MSILQIAALYCIVQFSLKLSRPFKFEHVGIKRNIDTAEMISAVSLTSRCDLRRVSDTAKFIFFLSNVFAE